jgi:hypothetical protein
MTYGIFLLLEFVYSGSPQGLSSNMTSEYAGTRLPVLPTFMIKFKTKDFSSLDYALEKV